MYVAIISLVERHDFQIPNHGDCFVPGLDLIDSVVLIKYTIELLSFHEKDWHLSSILNPSEPTNSVEFLHKIWTASTFHTFDNLKSPCDFSLP